MGDLRLGVPNNSGDIPLQLDSQVVGWPRGNCIEPRGQILRKLKPAATGNPGGNYKAALVGLDFLARPLHPGGN